jgi:alkanesulfonate monooxygenase SsuD/methylene tetrahydromethanopterin reductase-like flavin-dependent oxidoreductase (luciferase family)
MQAQLEDNPRLSNWNGNKLKLGFFAPNCSSGRNASKLPERWSASWDRNLELARLADQVGIDFLLPIGRWKGYGGETDYHGASLETITWATGLLASTRRIVVFGTVHAPLFHPIIAAKQMVTADHVGHGRFGLNVVCGWNVDEFEMFGANLREHERRYAYAQEWLDAVKAMWGEGEDYDIKGEFFDLRGVRAKPKPHGGGRPIIMNAGSSPDGLSFATRNCDAYFTATRIDTLDSAAGRVAEIKDYARRQGRSIGVFTTGEVCCAPTRREAEELFHYRCVENADWSAVEVLMPLYGQPIDRSDPRFEEKRKRFAYGLSGFLARGTPDDVADAFERISAAGFDGVAFSFFDYAGELPYFAQEVLPRLERAGVRVLP